MILRVRDAWVSDDSLDTLTFVQVEFVPMGLTAQPGGIILVLRMPAVYLDTQMSLFQAIVEVASLPVLGSSGCSKVVC